LDFSGFKIFFVKTYKPKFLRPLSTALTMKMRHLRRNLKAVRRRDSPSRP